MSEIDIQKLMELAQLKLQENVSPQEALQSLVDAGLVDQQGNMTAPYQELAGEE